jgi:hypothetical protein
MLHKGHNRKGSIAKKKKISGRESQGVLCLDELIGGKAPVVKYFSDQSLKSYASVYETYVGVEVKFHQFC